MSEREAGISAEPVRRDGDRHGEEPRDRHGEERGEERGPGHGDERDVPVLHLESVGRVHGEGRAEVHALRGVDLTVRAGELVAVMGPSGSGKSTLLNLAGGLDRATSGKVWIEGVDLSTLRPQAVAALRRRSVGVVFQDYNLIGSLTAVENVSLPLELDGMRVAEARRLGREALARVGVGEVEKRFPDEVSGGQRQRIAIARALVGRRRLVLADEPTGALDSLTGEGVLELLRRRCDGGAAGLLVTHEARHAAWADRIVYLRDGRVVDDAGRPVAASSGAAAEVAS